MLSADPEFCVGDGASTRVESRKEFSAGSSVPVRGQNDDDSMKVDFPERCFVEVVRGGCEDSLERTEKGEMRQKFQSK